MPIINIETVQHINHSVKNEILKAMHDLVTDTLQIPAKACHIRWMEIDKNNYYCSTDMTANHTYIEIKLFPGRSLEVKKSLYRSIFNTLNNYNVATNDLMIALNEIPMENWGMEGGVPCSEIALDYKVNI